MIRQPISVPRTVPSPPLKLPPPMTTAAITWSSRPSAQVGSPIPPSWSELKHAGQARRQAAERVDDDLDERHVDPAQPRRGLVRADRVDVTAQQAVAQDQRHQDAQKEQHPHPGATSSQRGSGSIARIRLNHRRLRRAGM